MRNVKEFFKIIAIVTIIGLCITACEGPTGATGPEGPKGGNATPCINHVWSAWEITDPPNCWNTGFGSQYCTVCGVLNPNTVVPKAHNYHNGICSACYSIEMVQINAGTFSMGLEGIANPVRNVKLSAFKMSKYTVT